MCITGYWKLAKGRPPKDPQKKRAADAAAAATTSNKSKSPQFAVGTGNSKKDKSIKRGEGGLRTIQLRRGGGRGRRVGKGLVANAGAVLIGIWGITKKLWMQLLKLCCWGRIPSLQPKTFCHLCQSPARLWIVK